MRYIFYLFIPLLFICGCNVINPVEDTPTYIYLDSFSFTVNDPLKEGSASQKITSAWVYFNNSPVGVFELPAKVPIIAKTDGVVSVTPGVTYSGLSQQTAYPFFMPDTFSLKRAEGQVTHPIPNISYASATKFMLKEDFETGNTFSAFQPDLTNDTTIVRTDDKSKVFEGGGSGYIYVDASHPVSENISNQGFPITAGQSFIELNYKCNTSFQVGLLTSYNGGIIYKYLGGVLAKESWNKIYIDLSKFTASYPSSKYTLMIKTGLDEGISTGYVLLDNIKVVSY